MGDSYRVRTQVGINQTLTVQLDQDFEFLEILSLKIQQSDIYTRSCSDYGVVVGRVIANNGFGIPNAKISVFVPISSVDESNPVLTSIYPYKSPEDINEDGYRYNLLPYEKSYSKHAATGTFPSRNDVLTNNTVIEIYDKYYKFTAKTNESGDYMLMGVPLGTQTLVMDLDLSDMGEFSLTPQDLVRLGIATPQQVNGSTFKTSNDLNTLPQIINLIKDLDVSPLWGDPSVCQIAVNRLDFDLTKEANIEIRPTAIFMGSIFSSPDDVRVRPGRRLKADLGNLCNLTTGPGQILAIRQTINQDEDGNPVLETFTLDNSGNVIDSDGTWITELPMNLDYITTNEFGEKVVSFNPEIGIPTKAKYRFKIKWQQSKNLSEGVRRAYYLVPNIKEYGWFTSFNDPNSMNNNNVILSSSYYFGLAWSGYTNGFTTTEKTQRLNEIINCDDVFYQFEYNRVYTVSQLIDQWQRGGASRFIGIKQINDDECGGSINRFPTNDGFLQRSASYIFGVFLLNLLTYLIYGVLPVMHIAYGIFRLITGFLCLLCNLEIPIINVRPFKSICTSIGFNCSGQIFRYLFKLPMISYPECTNCDCGQNDAIIETLPNGTGGALSYVSSPNQYVNCIVNKMKVQTFKGVTPEDINVASFIFSQAIAGNNGEEDFELFKEPVSDRIEFPSNEDRHLAYSDTLPLGERINVFNTRKSFFDGINKIGVTFSYMNNPGKIHYDNTLTVLSNVNFSSGQLLTFVNPQTTNDLNYRFSAETNDGVISGISGTSQTQPFNITVRYATGQQTEQIVNYFLPTGTTIENQVYPMDREYYQVITAITISQAAQIWFTGNSQDFPNILNVPQNVYLRRKREIGEPYKLVQEEPFQFNPLECFDNYQNQYILILQRGVDPYSPKFQNEYRIGKIFGKGMDDITITANTRVNIPIQKLNDNKRSVQRYNQQDMFYPSYFFEPGNQFSSVTTTTVGYYGAFDAEYPDLNDYDLNDRIMLGVNSVVTRTGNEFYSNNSNAAKYDLSEDLSSSSYLWSTSFSNYDWYSPTSKVDVELSPIILSNKQKNIMRNDRLPSSDVLNGEDWNNTGILQQNNNFEFYIFPESIEGQLPIIPGIATLPSENTPDIEGLPGSINVLETFTCEKMVDLNCYTGNSTSFGVNPECLEDGGDNVDMGCYVFIRIPIIDLFKDYGNLTEWSRRYRLTFALCSGIISEMFSNNWINGTLFHFPILINTRYNLRNEPISQYPNELIYFDKSTNNFYYRSSPYNQFTNKFIGQSAITRNSLNRSNLLFPTTIINLGVKDEFYQEILIEPSAKLYTLPLLNGTSYSENSDLINFFAVSRLIDLQFWQAISSFFAPDLALFLDRNERVDGDLSQLISINSEIGVNKFSTDFYGTSEQPAPIQILQVGNKNIIAVWFSSTTLDLQFKDFITPGAVSFFNQSGQQVSIETVGIKSQDVPFYQWELKKSPLIFGSSYNDWATDSNDIFSKPYQSLDRTNPTIPGYFQSTTVSNNANRRGYIFSTDANGVYSDVQYLDNKFLVGAPFQFYFGIYVGSTAIDKYKSKYLQDE